MKLLDLLLSFLILNTCAVFAFISFNNRRWSNVLQPALLAKKKRGVEFSRMVNIVQVPKKKPVLCRILANENELNSLADRLDLAGLTYFGANVTVQWQDSHTLQVLGSLEAHMSSNIVTEAEVVKSDFSSTLLNNIGVANPVSLDDTDNYDDEVREDGNIDIGELVTQYFALELY